MSIKIHEHKKYLLVKEIENLYYIIYDKSYTKSQLDKFSINSYKGVSATRNTLELMLFLELLIKDKDVFVRNKIFEINKKEFQGEFIKILFKKVCIDTNIIQYNEFYCTDGTWFLRKSGIPIKYFALRNLLIAEKVINLSSESYEINKDYQNLIESIVKNKQKKLTLANLKQQLEFQEKLGEQAEIFVMDYEKKLLSCKFPERVSPIDVSAGYDIRSYLTDESSEFDKFIEVKCFSENVEFYWSKNEIEVAKELKENYFLYLVDNKFDTPPCIVRNPYFQVYLNKKIKREVQNYKFFLE
ncbi:DUF3883 domain-containing protein [Listeria booriae]|uniref:DUF3883 domain-containing protein n=1 Tax=Listeria booriae TaxID=1552123 RepID=UPI00162892EF|nr:DUF3883 domain-containing protein [Listeria booriae]MBC2264398.1 DUF3883 domain-containing protein [Listeria booriae]